MSDIAYFFVLDKGVFLRTFAGKTYSVDYSLDKLESSILEPAVFSRINRKYIVNIKAIRDMAAWSRSRIKLKLDPPADNEDDIIVSIERSPGFKKWLNR
ncbi:MAG: LytTR family DNA-binding domain-containing protein [Bacteroidales bacterium]|nr:LytTR family DNA-binding domain-containing protein [Bacteroidales bacterium]